MNSRIILSVWICGFAKQARCNTLVGILLEIENAVIQTLRVATRLRHPYAR